MEAHEVVGRKWKEIDLLPGINTPPHRLGQETGHARNWVLVPGGVGFVPGISARRTS